MWEAMHCELVLTSKWFVLIHNIEFFLQKVNAKHRNLKNLAAKQVNILQEPESVTF